MISKKYIYKKNMLRKKMTMIVIYGLIFLISTMAFYFVNTSKAQNLIKFEVSVLDKDSNIEVTKYDLKLPEEESYKIELPSFQNGFKVKKYTIVSKKEFEEYLKQSGNEKQSEKKSTVEQENKILNTTTQNTLNEETSETEPTKKEDELSDKGEEKEIKYEEKNEIEPENEFEISDEQLKSKKIYLLAEYEAKEVNNIKLYNKIISKSTKNNNISITGFMPQNAEIQVKELDKEEVQNNIIQGFQDTNKKINLTTAYDIKIIVDKKEYEPEEFDESAVVTITNIESKNINIWHIKNDNTVEQIKPAIENKDINFKTDSFSVYGIEVVEDEIPEKNVQEVIEQETTKDSVNEEEIEAEVLNVKSTGIKKSATRDLPDATLEIDDYMSDYYYYMGQNYTNTISGTNSNLYSDNNLVKVTLNYYGFAQGETSNEKKGRISLDDGETQNIVKNIKCVPVENGNVSIELMENPFMDKPTGFGFGGWTSSDGTISKDNKTLTQTIVATASSNMAINLYANWVEASVVYVNQDNGNDNLNNGLSEETPFGSWGKAFEYLNSHNTGDRETNIIVLTGNIDSSINYTRTVTGRVSKPVLTYKFESSTNIVADKEVILSTTSGSGGNVISTSGNTISNVQLTTPEDTQTSQKWIISSTGYGYTIKNMATNYYLAYDDGLIMQSSPYTWNYTNRRFYATVSTGGWFGRTYYYYIRYTNNNWTITQTQNQRNTI